MAKFWCTPDGNKVFPESDFANVPGLALIDFSEDGEAAKAPAGDSESPSRDELVKQYEAKFGRRPHHSMKTENIIKSLME